MAFLMAARPFRRSEAIEARVLGSSVTTNSQQAGATKASSDANGGGEALDVALARFEKAIATLEDAVDEVMSNRFGSEGAKREVEALLEDRREMAQRLDRTEARAQTLHEANAQVSRRIVSVMESIRAAIDD